MHRRWLLFIFMSSVLVSDIALAVMPSDFMLNAVLEPSRLNFADALRVALERNDELKRVQEQIHIAKGEALIATSKLLPKLNTRLSYETPARVPSSPGDGEATLGISAQIPLLDAKNFIDMRGKRESSRAAKDKLLEERNRIIYEIGALYIDAAIAQALMDNASEERDIYQKHVAIFERKSKVGQARNLDIRRAHYLAAKAYSDFVLKRQDALKKMGALGRKIGVENNFLLSELSISSPHLQKDASTLTEMAKSAPDIVVLSKELSAASFFVLGDKFDFLPKFHASFEGGWQTTTSMHRLLDPIPDFNSRIMLMLDLPLFSGGSTIASLKINHAKKAIAEVNLRTKMMEKNLAINSALTEMSDLEAVLASAQLALEAALLAKESAQRMFDNNEATGLELVEANSNHFSAKNLMANSRLSLERAKLQLLHAVGAIGEVLPN